jgi:PAS domain-containing protein
MVVPALLAFSFFAPPLRPYFVGEGRSATTAVLEHPGATYGVYLAYVSCLMVLATVIVVRFSRSNGEARRESGQLLLLAMMLPWGASVVSSFSPVVFGIEPTVVALGVTTAIFAFLVLAENILDVGQLARQEILNAMREGFIAVNQDLVVVECNDRALQLLELPAESVLRRPLATALAKRQRVLDAVVGQGAEIVERIRIALSTQEISPRISVSAGVVQIQSDDSLMHAIATADRALYLAKQRGRDGVVRFSESEIQL